MAKSCILHFGLVYWISEVLAIWLSRRIHCSRTSHRNSTSIVTRSSLYTKWTVSSLEVNYAHSLLLHSEEAAYDCWRHVEIFSLEIFFEISFDSQSSISSTDRGSASFKNITTFRHERPKFLIQHLQMLFQVGWVGRKYAIEFQNSYLKYMIYSIEPNLL